MTIEKEKSLHERQRLANAHYEQRRKRIHEQETVVSEPQGHIAAPQTEQAKNTIRKKQQLQLRKYLIGGEGKQNDGMLATITSFVEFECGKIINVGCLPWVVVGEMPLHELDRVEVTV